MDRRQRQMCIEDRFHGVRYFLALARVQNNLLSVRSLSCDCSGRLALQYLTKNVFLTGTFNAQRIITHLSPPEQYQIVPEIESRLSVADALEREIGVAFLEELV